uniref:Uncharacterized protein n=1 Tax=Chrysotila carterae TaxID=13221 RepID=A0A7S4C0J9_CHRCT|mmetsp:Transcript_57375/g.124674  ORF Transcript_57375/g.124674 Transcript_57375/m.124674 type:complete len:215 (+) Transcript_57375:343-987(+)
MGIGTLLNLIAANRPFLLALLICAIAYVLFRTPREAPPPSGDNSQPSGALTPTPSSSVQKRETLSLATSGVILYWENMKPKLRPGAAEGLFQLCSFSDVYLITTLPQDADDCEESVMALFTQAGFFEPGRIERHKALFCTTEDGRGAMCRQLTPATHVDTSATVAAYLLPHLPMVVQVVGPNSSGHGQSRSDKAPVLVHSFDAFVQVRCAMRER